MHIAVLKTSRANNIVVYPLQAVQIAVLQWHKALTKILAKYADYVDIFSVDLAMVFSKTTNIIKHIIKFIKDKQLPYSPIYTLSLVKLEILKVHIKTHLKIGFIWLFKSPIGALILFNK